MTNTYTATGTALTLAPRWNNIAVTNAGASAVWVTTNGFVGTPSSSVDGAVEVPAGATVVVANQLPVWYQSQTVINSGSGNYAFQDQFQLSQNGQVANPGTQINASGAVTIAGCG